jgi:hypothetical protein
MEKDISYPVFLKYLTRSTFIFLVVPYLIFFYGWLYWWVAIPMTVICLYPIFWDWKQPYGTSDQGGEKNAITLQQIAIVCGGALFLVLISGIGGWGYQNTDWEKHNILLRDLVEQPWPLIYQFGTFHLPFDYYFAYYLPAALVGKMFGWISANHALMVESWIGLSLALLWGFALIKQSWWKAALIVGCFAGLDVIGFLLTMPIAPMLLGKPMNIYSLEWWSIAWNYPSFNRVLFWMPNQGLIGWLATSLILNEIFNRERKYTIWYLALTTFWSPFVTVGLIPLVMANWIAERDTFYAWIRKYGLPNLCGVLLGGLIGFMYIAKFYPLPPQVSGKILSDFIFVLASGDKQIIEGLVILLILFWLLECGLYGILTWKLLDKDDKQSRLILAVGLVILAMLPFYQYGYYNDLLHKASIPSLFALSIILGRTVLAKNVKRRTQLALTILLCIGFLTAFINIGIQFDGMIKNGAVWHLPAASEVDTLLQLQEKEKARAFKIEGFEFTSFVSQYIGSGDAPFFQWFVRK